MAITDWPAHDRPRERLIKGGPQYLSDAELLAIFLRTGTSGKSAVDLGREIMMHFGSLSRLFSAQLKGFFGPERDRSRQIRPVAGDCGTGQTPVGRGLAKRGDLVFFGQGDELSPALFQPFDA